MNNTITRKFLVKKLPDLSNIEKTVYDRYYLFADGESAIRVQSVNNFYQLERKINISELIREEQNIEITKNEFEALKKLSNQNIKRDSYLVLQNPKTVLRIYHGNFEGLKRVEVSFGSEDEAKEYKTMNWFGKEITNSPLAQDGKLLKLSADEFSDLLN